MRVRTAVLVLVLLVLLLALILMMRELFHPGPLGGLDRSRIFASAVWVRCLFQLLDRQRFVDSRGATWGGR